MTTKFFFFSIFRCKWKKKCSRASGFMDKWLKKAQPSKEARLNSDSPEIQTSVGEQITSSNELHKHEQEQKQQQTEFQDGPTTKKEEISVQDPDTRRSCFAHIHRDGHHYIRCELCFKCPDTVKCFSTKRRVPPIAHECATISTHQEQLYHKEAEKAP